MKTQQVRLPDELREEADNALNEIGMDMSTAIRVYPKPCDPLPSPLNSGEDEPDPIQTID